MEQLITIDQLPAFRVVSSTVVAGVDYRVADVGDVSYWFDVGPSLMVTVSLVPAHSDKLTIHVDGDTYDEAIANAEARIREVSSLAWAIYERSVGGVVKAA